jgi:hypothetical protein
VVFLHRCILHAVLLSTAAGLWNKGSHLAPALGATKLIIVINMSLVTLCVLLKSDLEAQQTHLWCPNNGSLTCRTNTNQAYLNKIAYVCPLACFENHKQFLEFQNLFLLFQRQIKLDIYQSVC